MTRLLAVRWMVAKSVNGGPSLLMGSYATKEQAECAALEMYVFHTDRCPNDKVEMFVREA